MSDSSNSHIQNMVNAVVNKISTLITSHNSNSDAHSSLFSGKADSNHTHDYKSHYYGTCSTAAATQTKEVTSSDFTLATGAILSVKFINAQTYNATASSPVKLYINGTYTVNVAYTGSTLTSRYHWSAGEVVSFAYDGTNFVMINGGLATTTYYGVTKLSSATNSTSAAMAATPAAVKTAYDLAAGKADASHTHTESDITDLSIPTKTSELTNDSGFLTSHQSLSNYYTKTEIDNMIGDIEEYI